MVPLLDPRFLSHQYDRRVTIEGVRQVQRILDAPVFASRTIERLGPKDNSDEVIWEHVRQNTHSSWHMSCSARMGNGVDAACVDSNFRVFGLDGLRIVDLSVCPFIPKYVLHCLNHGRCLTASFDALLTIFSNHTQSTAYVVGEIAAEKLMAENNLNNVRKAPVAKL